MPLHVHTAQNSYDGDDQLDVTRKTNHPLGRHFAPSFGLFLPYVQKREAGLAREVDWLGFSAGYEREMRRSYVKHSKAWQELLGRPRVTLTCFCPTYHCHRFLLAKILGKLGAVEEGERLEEES